MPFPDSAHWQASRGCSAIPRCAWSPSCGREKTICGGCGTVHYRWYDRRRRRARDLPCAGHRIYLDLEVRRVDCRRCGVKTERLECLLENALHTRRFARHVGRRCRSSTIRDVASEEHLDWQTVKRLEKEYMREQLIGPVNRRPPARSPDRSTP